MSWDQDLILVAIKEAEHAYEITGIAQGIKSDLTVENWRPNQSYIETVGVNATARRMGDHIHNDNPETYH